MNSNLGPQFRVFAQGEHGESLAFEPGPDGSGYKEFNRIGEALKFTRERTYAHPYDEHEGSYRDDPVPVGEYRIHEGGLSHRIEPGTGRAIEENIRNG